MYKILIWFLLVIVYLSVIQAQKLKAPDVWEARHNQLQPIEKVARAIGLKPGMVVGEIGAGRGRYAVQLARYVGQKGIIYANDIDMDALNYLELRCKRDTINNIKIVKGKMKDPRFPKGKLDMAFMVYTYHHIEHPVEVLKNTIPALKPSGFLVIVEATPEKNPDWEDHHTPKEKQLKEAAAAGYELVKIDTFLKNDDIYIFKVKANK